jgi:hypothetical protein
MLVTAWLHRDPTAEAINVAVLQCLAVSVEALGGPDQRQLAGTCLA